MDSAVLALQVLIAWLICICQLQGGLANICDSVPNGESVPDVNDCTQYYSCFGGVSSHDECRTGTFFNQVLKHCDNTDAFCATPPPQEATSASYTEAITPDAATTTIGTTAALSQTTTDPATTTPMATTELPMTTPDSTAYPSNSTQTSQYGMFQMKGSVGSRLSTHVLVTQGARSVIDCARLCEFSEQCQSFNYRGEAGNGSCELNTIKITSTMQLILATGYTYWEK